MSDVLPDGSNVRVALTERGAPMELCGLGIAEDRRTALEWTAGALSAGEDAGANLARRQAPLVAGVHLTGSKALSGLPGFLADSLPDAWGRLLVDRQLRKLGISPRSLSGLDRLAIVGDRGAGALSYRPIFPMPADDEARHELDLDELAAAAHVALAGDEPELLDALHRAGGSAGGSRPKAWIAVTPDGRLRSGADELAEGEVGWLVKFRAPRHDPEDIGALELAYAHMAAAAGLEVPEARLFEGSSGRYFGGRRFDRVGGRRVHVLTAAALLDVAPEEAAAADYVDLLKLTRHVTRSVSEVIEAYRHAVFNVMAHNRDDHLKQFGFRRSKGLWSRTPAYDLTFSHGPAGEHTLLVAGEGRAPAIGHLEALAERSGVERPAARRVVEQVQAACAQWATIARACGVSRSSERTVAQHMVTF